LHEQLSDWMYAETDPVGFSPSYTDSTLTQIQRSNMLPLPKPHALIPFKNGLLDPRTRKLIPTTPNNALTWSLPYDYLPNAQCSTIQKWLHQMVGDEDTVQLLRAFMAALIRGPAKYQRFLHLIGPGGSGKSTFIRLLQMMTGQKNTVSTDLRQLEQNRFEAATLYGKQLALITDSDKYGGSINVLKALTGQDPIRLERKHVQQSGSFIFEGLVVMASNESLTTTDYTSGLERRRVTVPFENRVTEEEKQRWYECGGEDQLHQEIPGLINWLLSMPLDEMEKRITRPPAKVVKANTEAMRDSNPIADWVMENCTPTYGAWTQIGVKNEVKDMGQTHSLMAGDHLYPNYLRWCLQHGRQSLSTRRFSPNVIDALKNCLGVDAMKTGRNGLMGIQGIRLRGEDEPVYEWLKNSQVEGW
jgi:putative DNA primase/helicase